MENKMDNIVVRTSLHMDIANDKRELAISRAFSFRELVAMGNATAIKQNMADEVGRQFLLALDEAVVRARDADKQQS
jgi:hypothetical protein